MRASIAVTCVIAARLINAEVYASGANDTNTASATEGVGGEGVTDVYTHYHNQARFEMTVNKTAECNEIFGTNFTLAATNFGEWILYATGMNDTTYESIEDLFYDCVDPDTSFPILTENRSFDNVGDAEDDDYVEDTNGPDSVTLIRGPMMRGTLGTNQYSKRLANQWFSFYRLANSSGGTLWKGTVGDSNYVTINSRAYSRSWWMNNHGCCQSRSAIWPHRNFMNGNATTVRMDGGASASGNRNTYSFKP